MNSNPPPPKGKTIVETLPPAEFNLLSKISYLARRAEATRRAVSALKSDYHKRVIARAVYLQVDSFIELGRRLKNSLFKSSHIDKKIRDQLDEKFTRLDRDYRGIYESIRDKVSAHRQEETIDSIIDNWNAVDLLSIDVFVDDMIEVMSILSVPLRFKWQASDHAKIDSVIQEFNSATVPEGSSPTMSSDSLALTRGNTLGMLACHPDQEKAMAILSVIDFLDMLSGLTHFSQKIDLLHEVVWSLMVVDAFSLIDNLYDEARHESLLSKWQNGQYKGHHILLASANSRNLTMESEVREIRNKFAAHVDSDMTYRDLIKMVSAYDLANFLVYVGSHIDSFHQACAHDIRTRLFNIRNAPMNGVLAVEEKAVKKFED
ncbi:MAG: hypothetical protein K2Q26_03670 [Bdellovibrionales bacterium]|nr:hypothetical protein [Bdellovibrionales bacterium]